MTDTTTPGGEAAAEVVSVPAEQDFTAFENSLSESESETAEQVETDQAPDFADPDDPEADAEESDDDEADLEEIEHKGKKYKVPKGYGLREADYTVKTQELAELRKRFETLTNTAEELSREELSAQADYIRVVQQIADYQDIDWQAWRAQDPVAALQGQLDYQALEQAKGEIAGRFQAARAERSSLAQREAATRLEQGRKVLASKIPDWGETKQRQIIEHTMNAYGFDPADLAEIDDPRVILVMHDALQFAAMSKKQQAAVKAAQVQAVKPAPTLRGNASRAGPRADTNDFLAFERLANAKLAKR